MNSFVVEKILRDFIVFKGWWEGEERSCKHGSVGWYGEDSGVCPTLVDFKASKLMATLVYWPFTVT